MIHSVVEALNKCIDGYKAMPEVIAVYANSMHIFVFYEAPHSRAWVGLMDRLYAVFNAYIDDNAYSLKEIYYFPDDVIDEPDNIVQDTPLLYIRGAVDRKVGE